MDTLTGKTGYENMTRIMGSIQALQYQTMLTKAAQLARAGHYSSAEQLLASLPVEFRSNTEVLDLLARISAQQGLLTEAHGFWSRANQMDNASPAYQAGISRISATQRKTGNYYLIKTGIGFTLVIALLILTLSVINNYIQIPLHKISSDLSHTVSGQNTIHQRLENLSLAQNKISLNINKTPAMIQKNNTELSTRLSKLEKQTASLISYFQERKAPDIKLHIPGVSIRTEGSFQVLTFDKGLFVTGLILSSKSRETLDLLGKQLDQYAPGIHITVTGHTDDRPVNNNGRISSNHQLGLSRAANVVSYLHEKTHLPTSLFSIQGHHNVIPGNNITQADRARMRTVTLKIHKLIAR